MRCCVTRVAVVALFIEPVVVTMVRRCCPDTRMHGTVSFGGHLDSDKGPCSLLGNPFLEQLGSDNPDNLYLNAMIDGRRHYKVTGTRGTVPILMFGSQVRADPGFLLSGGRGVLLCNLHEHVACQKNISFSFLFVATWLSFSLCVWPNWGWRPKIGVVVFWFFPPRPMTQKLPI